MCRQLHRNPSSGLYIGLFSEPLAVSTYCFDIEEEFVHFIIDLHIVTFSSLECFSYGGMDHVVKPDSLR